LGQKASAFSEDLDCGELLMSPGMLPESGAFGEWIVVAAAAA
jgi:hypothetical protein